MGALNWQDWRIGRAFRIILDLVVRNAELSSVVLGSRLNDDKNYTFRVISVGEEAFSDNLEKLEKMDMPMPEYLKQVEDYISGPEVLYYMGV
jgi:hypothetical protein